MKNPNASQHKKALKVLEKHEKWLRKFDGVYDVGLGFPITDGEMDFTQLEILVYVKKKKSVKGIKKTQRLPEVIDGIAVDVIQSQPKVHSSLADAMEGIRNPLIGGIAIGNSSLKTTGTLGMIVKRQKNNKPVGLSNWHVLKRRKGNRGNPVVQPGNKPNSERFQIGHVHRWNKKLDCATFKLNGRRHIATATSIFNIDGRVTRLQAPFIGMQVMKNGAMTGLTYGMVASISAKGTRIRIVPNPNKPADQNEISDAGDSGAIWVTDEGNKKAVALHWGGDKSNTANKEFAMANSLKAVFECLELKL